MNRNNDDMTTNEPQAHYYKQWRFCVVIVIKLWLCVA